MVSSGLTGDLLWQLLFIILVLGVAVFFISGLKFGPRFQQRQEKRWLHSYTVRKLDPLDNNEGKTRAVKVRDLEKESKHKIQESAREPLSIPTMRKSEPKK